MAVVLPGDVLVVLATRCAERALLMKFSGVCKSWNDCSLGLLSEQALVKLLLNNGNQTDIPQTMYPGVETINIKPLCLKPPLIVLF